MRLKPAKFATIFYTKGESGTFKPRKTLLVGCELVLMG